MENRTSFFFLVVVAAAAAYNRSLNETTVFSDDFVTFFESSRIFEANPATCDFWVTEVNFL